MSTKTKVLNVHADSPDLRDRIYNPTLRLLVSNAFEHGRGKAILGMETFFEKRPSLTRQRPRRAAVWDWIAAPTTSTDTTRRSNSTSHGGFDDDQATRLAVIERIVRRHGVASAAAPRHLKQSNRLDARRRKRESDDEK